MTTAVLYPSVTCPACDGDGSLSAQMAKEEWIRLGGGSVRRILKHNSVSEYQNIYFTPDGNEICFKTIGGPCSLCQGKKVVDKTQELLYSTSEITIDEAVIAREVDKETGVIAINGYRFPKQDNFPGEIKLALTKEAAKSLVGQLSKLLKE